MQSGYLSKLIICNSFSPFGINNLAIQRCKCLIIIWRKSDQTESFDPQCYSWLWKIVNCEYAGTNRRLSVALQIKGIVGIFWNLNHTNRDKSRTIYWVARKCPSHLMQILNILTVFEVPVPKILFFSFHSIVSKYTRQIGFVKNELNEEEEEEKTQRTMKLSMRVRRQMKTLFFLQYNWSFKWYVSVKSRLARNFESLFMVIFIIWLLLLLLMSLLLLLCCCLNIHFFCTYPITFYCKPILWT